MAWTKVDFLESGQSYYRSVLFAIGHAKHSVLIEKYIFRFDRTGRAILTALSAAQSRGVRIYIRIDGVGSRDELSAISEFCGSNKLELEVFHPLPFAISGAYHPAGFARVDSFMMRWRMMNRRAHRKLVIIDEKIAFSGGRNVDDVENEEYSGTRAWHDLSLRLEGDSIPTLVEAFWLRPFRRQPSRDFLLNYNWRLKLARNSWFHRRIQRARKIFWVVTPYFAPTPAILFQLRVAARRGVDIRLVLPKKNDVPLSSMAARALYRQLLGWGVRIFEYVPSILHRKLWVIDDLALVGSGNLNHRSFIHDLELDMVLRMPPHVERSRELFLQDMAQSQEILVGTLERLPWWKRMLYSMASWLVYWL
jgi:cardiolipin synthase